MNLINSGLRECTRTRKIFGFIRGNSRNSRLNPQVNSHFENLALFTLYPLNSKFAQFAVKLLKGSAKILQGEICGM
jgi:hypothetical protein